MRSKDAHKKQDVASPKQDAKKATRKKFNSLLILLLRLPLATQLVLSWIALVLLTNHTAIVDLIALIKALKS